MIDSLFIAALLVAGACLLWVGATIGNLIVRRLQQRRRRHILIERLRSLIPSSLPRHVNCGCVENVTDSMLLPSSRIDKGFPTPPRGYSMSSVTGRLSSSSPHIQEIPHPPGTLARLWWLAFGRPVSLAYRLPKPCPPDVADEIWAAKVAADAECDAIEKGVDRVLAAQIERVRAYRERMGAASLLDEVDRAGVEEAIAAEAAGDPGQPWEEVKRDLNIPDAPVSGVDSPSPAQVLADQVRADCVNFSIQGSDPNDDELPDDDEDDEYDDEYGLDPSIGMKAVVTMSDRRPGEGVSAIANTHCIWLRPGFTMWVTVDGVGTVRIEHRGKQLMVFQKFLDRSDEADA